MDRSSPPLWPNGPTRNAPCAEKGPKATGKPASFLSHLPPTPLKGGAGGIPPTLVPGLGKKSTQRCLCTHCRNPVTSPCSPLHMASITNRKPVPASAVWLPSFPGTAQECVCVCRLVNHGC